MSGGLFGTVRVLDASYLLAIALSELSIAGLDPLHSF